MYHRNAQKVVATSESGEVHDNLRNILKKSRKQSFKAHFRLCDLLVVFFTHKIWQKFKDNFVDCL